MKNQSTKQPKVDTLIMPEFHFPVGMYTVNKPEFLERVREVATEAINQVKSERPQLHELYPVYQTGNIFNDPRIADFVEVVARSAWNILDSQGYQMVDMATTYTEMWVQEHYKHSAMDQHIHANGAQIVGFYFLETPENCSWPVLHDPRVGKVQTNLPEKNPGAATFASNTISLKPEPGLLFFSNAWVPHSFTRHGSDTPFRFIHFTLTVVPNQQQTIQNPVVI